MNQPPKCAACGGKGTVRLTYCHPGWHGSVADPCRKCNGTGFLFAPTSQADRLAALGRHPSNSPFAMQRT